MIADAAHSLSDLLSDAVSLWALRAARAPADADHPYGHGKFEAVGSACVGVLLLAAGGGIGVHAATVALTTTAAEPLATAAAQLGAAGVAVLSLVVKETLFRLTHRVGEEVRSSTLIANAWHHRSDALSSVVALAGLVGSIGGLPFVDPLAGVLVAGMIMKEGAAVSQRALRELTDTQVDEELLASVVAAARTVDDVQQLTNVRGRVLGPHLLVDMRIAVEPSMSVSIAHQVAIKVEREVRLRVPEVTEVLVHLETTTSLTQRRSSVRMGDAPWVEHASEGAEDAGVPPAQQATSSAVSTMRPRSEIESDVKATLATIPEIWGCSHVHLQWDSSRGGASVHVDLVMDPSIRVTRAMHIGATAKRALEEGVADVFEADVHLELVLPPRLTMMRELMPREWALVDGTEPKLFRVSPQKTAWGLHRMKGAWSRRMR
jgi:cation diffusion facilitator family transporter